MSFLRQIPFAAIRDVSTKRPSAGRNLDALDGIRGLAVLIVIVAHTKAFRLGGQGVVGVWLFFALSGFLLTLPFARDPDRILRRGELAHYFSRRVRRVLPAYYFIITTMFFFGDWTLRTFGLHLVFARAELILWTIPQELLFYLILPVLIASYPLVFRRKLLPAVVAFAALATAANLWLDESAFPMHGAGTLMRFHLGIFVTGMISALLYESRSVRRLLAPVWVRWPLDVLGIAILAALFFTAEYFHDNWFGSVPMIQDLFSPMSWSYRGTFGVLSSALILIALVTDGGVTSRICRSFPLRALGVVSYSLYLVHWTVKEKFIDLGLGYGPGLFLATLFAGYLVACALYSLVERPFLQVKTRRAD